MSEEVEYKPREVFNADTEKNVVLTGSKAEGEWTAPPAPASLPVSDEVYINNVRSACKLDLPNVVEQEEHDKIMVMICGGASAKDYIEDIRTKSKDDKYHIFCSNKTHDWLIENDIIPHTQVIVDPKPAKVKDVENPHNDVRYLIGISCVPEVFEKLKGYNVHRLFAFSGVGRKVGYGVTDIQIAQAFFGKDEFTSIEGGTMAGLRAMTIGSILGYKTVEFYGFDSCFYEKDKDGYPIFYSYDKSRAENILDCQTTSGKIYQSTPVFASQARQFIKWKHRLAWMNFIIHGDSLTAEINKIDEEKLKPKGRLISDYMLKMNKVMHEQDKNFGTGVNTDIVMSEHAGRMSVLAGQLIKNHGIISILDYGCGKKEFENRMPVINGLTINNYDPCIEGLNDAPEPADIVVCIDVLEHIEFEYLNDVLIDMERLTKKLCYVSVCTSEASKFYSDGQNMHLIQEGFEWWYPRLRKYFDLTEVNTTRKHFNAILQKKQSNGNNGRQI
jgi:hypothetical protein